MDLRILTSKEFPDSPTDPDSSLNYVHTPRRRNLCTKADNRQLIIGRPVGPCTIPVDSVVPGLRRVERDDILLTKPLA